MHRSVRRTLIALAALASFWSAVVSEAYGLHSCAHHDGVLAGAAGTHAGDAHAAHSDAATSGQDAHGGHHEGVCTCVGDCAGAGGSAPLPGAAVAPRLTPAPTPPQVVAPRRVFLPLDPPDYLLPPATAPPRS